MPKSKTKSKNHHTLRPIKPRARRSKLHVLKYLPAIAMLGLSVYFGINPTSTRQAPAPVSGSQQQAPQSEPNTVLSYSTNVNNGDLLGSTNAERSGNGLSGLNLNSALVSAAQAKANDMAARNYWSHTTPEGDQPWVFITNAGYQYSTAGENLAYGFDTSSDAVTGWMNSPPHKANVLNTSYTEVGFGIANSADFNSSGEQTIVVAMYASPQAAAAPAPASTLPAQSQAPAPTQPVAEQPAPSAAEPVVAASDTQQESAPQKTQPISTGTAVASTASQSSVRRIQLLTNGQAAWSATLLVTAICAVGLLWALQRGFKFKKLILAGESFITHHLYVDATVVAFITLGVVLLRSSGIVR